MKAGRKLQEEDIKKVLSLIESSSTLSNIVAEMGGSESFWHKIVRALKGDRTYLSKLSRENQKIIKKFLGKDRQNFNFSVQHSFSQAEWCVVEVDLEGMWITIKAKIPYDSSPGQDHLSRLSAHNLACEVLDVLKNN